MTTNNPLKNTWTVFTLHELGQSLPSLLLLQIGKMFGYPFCANFMVPQVIMHYGTCGFMDDIQICSVFCQPSLIKTYALLMWACACDINGHPGRGLLVTLVLPTLNLSIQL